MMLVLCIGGSALYESLPQMKITKSSAGSEISQIEVVVCAKTPRERD
jgi:hypothetical protein